MAPTSVTSDQKLPQESKMTLQEYPDRVDSDAVSVSIFRLHPLPFKKTPKLKVAMSVR